MSKNDFQVDLDGNLLTISSEITNQKEEEEDEKFTRREFSYQSFMRSFTLPNELVDVERIQAKYENGMLSLIIPKKEETKQKASKRIQIK